LTTHYRLTAAGTRQAELANKIARPVKIDFYRTRLAERGVLPVKESNMASGPPQTPPDQPQTAQPASPVPAPTDQPQVKPDTDEVDGNAEASVPVWPT